MSAPCSSITRYIEWVDTDASGAHHYTTAFRLAEAAEASLHRDLGITERMFGRTPRVHVEADFRRPLQFGDETTCELCVAELGRSSIRYRFVVTRGGERCVEGSVVAAYVGDDGQPARWPDDLRAALRGTGA